jgi:hypothetical protein
MPYAQALGTIRRDNTCGNLLVVRETTNNYNDFM